MSFSLTKSLSTTYMISRQCVFEAYSRIDHIHIIILWELKSHFYDNYININKALFDKTFTLNGQIKRANYPLIQSSSIRMYMVFLYRIFNCEFYWHKLCDTFLNKRLLSIFTSSLSFYTMPHCNRYDIFTAIG